MKNNYFKTFGLCLIIAIMIFLPTLIKNKGLLTFQGDFQNQQVAFNINVNNELSKGNNLYTFNNDLGSSIIEGYSFYNLSSPFFKLGLLFDAKLYPYLITLFLILKFSLTGLFTYLYLEKFVSKKNLAILGAILYTFTGFQIYNIYFNHFHDLVMMFPLFLYSIDKLVMEDKRGLFIFILFLTILTNYVFAFGQLVFLLIYLIINFLTKRFELNKKNILKIIIELSLGILLSMVILLPSFLSVINNPRVSDVLSLKEYFIYPIEQYIKIFESMLLPCFTLFDASITNTTNWKSCELWIPFFGIVLSSIYVFKNRKDYLSIIIITLFIFMFIPILNSSFTLFNTEYYARWYYIISIFLVISSIKVLDQKTSINKNHLFKLIVLIYLFLITYYLIYVVSRFNLSNYYVMNLLLSICSLILLPFIIKKYYKKEKIIILIIPTIIFILIESYHFIYKSTNNEHNYIRTKETINLINKRIIKDDEFYRVKYYNCGNLNMNLYMNLNSVDSFNSSISGSAFKFYKSLNINRKQETYLSFLEPELLNYLSVKYVISCNGDLPFKDYNYLYKKNNLKIYKNNNYHKMGIMYEKLPVIKKFKTRKEIISSFSKYIMNNEIKTKEIENGLSSKVYMKKDGYILYTIPYDNNFSVTINGKSVKYKVKYNDFIVIKIEKGYNDIKLVYRNKYYEYGLYVAFITFIITILYLKKEKNK